MQPDRTMDTIDLSKPSMARMYDYALGGSHNFAVDREAAEKVLRANPDGRQGMFANRAFLRRAVRYLVAAGVRQFLDIGSGIPTAGNVHEVALAAEPACRVVYVDVDRVATVYSQELLAKVPQATAICADVREPDRILADPQLRQLLDLDQPVALLMLCLLHFIPAADDPVSLVARYRSRLAAGSYLAISHVTGDDESPTHTNAMREYSRLMTQVNLRSHAEVAALFTGFDLVDPGLVWLPHWRPEPEDDLAAPYYYYAGVGRLP